MNRQILPCSLFCAAMFCAVTSARADNEYMVEKGDTLYGIGKLLGVPYQEIIRANNLKNSMIHPDQILKIPTGGRVTDQDPAVKPKPAIQANASRTAARPSTTGLVHGTPVPSSAPLEAVFSSPASAQYSEAAYVPPVQGGKLLARHDPPVEPATYTVVEGDTIFGISRKFGVSALDLRKLNNIPHTAIFPGQVLILPEKSDQVSIAGY